MANPTLSTAEIEQGIHSCATYDIALLQQGMRHVRKIYEVANEMTLDAAKAFFTKYLLYITKTFKIDLEVGFKFTTNNLGVKFLDYTVKFDTKSKQQNNKKTPKKFSFGPGDINESAKTPQEPLVVRHWTTFPDSPIRLASPIEIAEKIKKLSPKLSTIEDDVVMTDA